MIIEGKNVKRFIAFGAHCDDIELRAGGVFSRLVREGAEGLYIIVVASEWLRDAAREKPYSAEEVIEIRRKEAECGAKILGAAKTEFLYMYPNNYMKKTLGDGEDLFFPQMGSYDQVVEEFRDVVFTGRQPLQYAVHNEDFLREMEKIVAGWNPDVIFTHCLADGHLNHNCTGWFVARVLERMGLQHELPLFQWHPGSAQHYTHFRPTHFMELSQDDVAQWQRSLEGFDSQFAQERVENYARTVAEFYGSKCGVKYAQAFLKAFFPSEKAATGKYATTELLEEEYWSGANKVVAL